MCYTVNILLANAKRNDLVKITNVNLDDKFCLRLREMGIVEGAKLKLANRGAFGSRVLAKGYERVAIDAKCAKCIEVEVVHGSITPDVTNDVARNDGDK